MKNTRLRHTSTSTRKITRRKLYMAMLTVMTAGRAFASPDGGAVVGGAGTIDQSGLNTTIHQTTERMAIDWQSFDVKSNERVQFVQPKSTSIALNRVISNKGSEILGRIDANGQVFLINPNGVVFGKDSQINVGGMIASGLNINPKDFMNGEFTLTALEGTEGKVINSGIINAATGGSITLVGQQVKNEGLISANLGAVSLAAGKGAVVTFDKAGLVGIKVTKEVLQKDLGVDAAVINSGEINAEGGHILITASVSQDIFSEAVNNGGMNKANSVVVHEDGSFTLGAGSDVVNTGSINASTDVGNAGQVVVLGNTITNSGNIHADTTTGNAGHIELHSTNITSIEQNAKVTAKASTQGMGGDVKVLGNKVGLFDAAEVNASGANGGGQVLIGGDQTGGNIKIRNADFIYVGENTNVKTDGLLNGDGGKLITFASDTARIYGALSARGGGQSGNGGFIETSGLKGFEIANTPDIGAAVGHAGTWLIDPFNIKIQSGGSDDLGNSSPFESTNNDAKFDINLLNSALKNNATVIVRTGSNGTQLGDITLSDNLTYDFSGTATLRLEAHNDIKINNNIVRKNNGSGTLNISLIANSDNQGGGNITIASNKTVETQGGDFTATGVDFTSFTDATSFGTIKTTNTTNTTGGAGDIKITASGNVNLGAMEIKNKFNNGTNTQTKNGSITVESTGGSVTLNNALEYNDTGLRNGDGTSVNGGGSAFLTIKANKNITLNGAMYDFYGDGRDALDINLTAGSDITIAADIYTAGGNFVASGGSFTSTGHLINTDDANDGTQKAKSSDTTFFPKAGDWSNGGDISIKASSVIDIGTVVTDSAALAGNRTGNLFFGGNKTTDKVAIKQTTSAPIQVAGSTTFDTGIGAISFINTGNDFTGSVSINAADSATFVAANDILLGNINLTGSGKTTITANTKSITQDANSTIVNHAGGAIELVAVDSISNVNIDTSGKNTTDISGGAGGDVTLSAGTISVAGINTSGGNATTTTPPLGAPVLGGVAGNIHIAAMGAANASIAIDGDLSAHNGTLNATPTALQSLITLELFGTDSGAITFASPLTSNVTVDGKTKKDSLTGFNADATWALAGVNTGTISSTSAKGVITFKNVEQLTGGSAGTNTVVGQNADTTWNITSANEGNVQTTADKLTYATFKNMQVLKGNSVADIFNLDFVFGGTVDAGAGSNTFNVRTTVGDLVGGAGDDNFVFFDNGIANSVNGGLGTNKLTARNADNTWSITSANVGKLSATNGADYVTTFSNIQTLQGGSFADIFNLDFKFDGAINSGAGSNTFNVRTTVGNLNGGDGDDNFVFFDNGIANSVNGGLGTNKLTARNADNTWSITSDNVGKLSATNGAVYVSTFSNIQTLQGGSFADIFNLDFKFDGAINSGAGSNTFNVRTTVGDIVGGADDDKFVFDANGVANSIDGGAGSNTLTGRDANNSWTISNTNEGSLRVTGDTTDYVKVFKHIQTLKGGALANIFTINAAADTLIGGGGDDSFVFSGVNNVGSANVIDGGAGVNTLSGRDAASVWTISGADSGNVAGYVTNFKRIQVLKGGTANDIFNLNAVFAGDINAGLGSNIFNINTALDDVMGGDGDDQFIINASGSVKNIDGGKGANSLKGRDETNTWKVTSTNEGNLNVATTFTNIQTLQGGKLDNVFIIDAAIENVLGGAGNDSFNFSSVNNKGSATTIDGGKGSNTLTGRNEASTWTITAANVGNTNYVTKFSNIQTLQGGLAADTFTLNFAFDGTITAGAGANVFNVNTTVNTLTGGNDADSFIFGATGAASSIDGGLGDNTLAGRIASPNTWTITAANIGSLSVTSNNAIYINKFSNIQHLQGGNVGDTFMLNFAFDGSIAAGSGANQFNVNTTVGDLIGGTGDDNFIFGSNGVADSINGGTGTNTLTGRDAANTWNITSATVRNLSVTNGATYVKKFSNIQVLKGGSSADIFNLDFAFDGVINAGAGANQFNIKTSVGDLIGGDGDDVFVLGALGAANSIDGGEGDNTLTGRDTANTWNITANNVGNLGVTNGATYVKKFSNIHTLQGGLLADIFNLDFKFDGVINAGAGDNIFTVSTAVGSLMGGADNDSFTLKAGGSAVSIDGGGGTNNTLTGSDDASTWDITAANTGKVTHVGTFSNIQTLRAGSAKNIFNINAAIDNVFGGGGDDSFVFSSANNKGSVKSIDAGLGVNTVIGRNTNNTWTLSAANVGNLQDADTKAVYASFTGVQKLQGGSAADTLIGFNKNADWNIDKSNEGSVGETGSADPRTSFLGIENVTGSTSTDNFVFTTNDSNITGVIDGGNPINAMGVNDTVDLQARTAAVTVDLGNNTIANSVRVKNIGTITASKTNATNNVIVGASDPDTAYTWVIDKMQSGTVTPITQTSAGVTSPIAVTTRFINFDHVHGGTNSDRFQVSDTGVIADIDGGDGDDFLDYSKKTVVDINLGSSGSLGTTNIKSIEGIVGNNDGLTTATSKSTISADGGNVWTIGSFNAGADGINDGQVIITSSGGTTKTVSFANFNIINGGAGDDHFVLTEKGQLIGTITGAGGADVFDASASKVDQIVSLNGHDLGVTNLIGVATVIGNAASNSRLVSATTSNEWKIGANGNGSLNNNAVKFQGFSRLVGGAFQDVFIIDNIDGLNVILDGGSPIASATVNDSVTINALAAGKNSSVGVGATANAAIKLINIDQVNATANSLNQNTLVADNANDNTWTITDQNKGVLNTRLSFDGFANLTGGDKNDLFNFTGALANITGIIDAGSGIDSINLVGVGHDSNVHVVNADKSVLASNINILNVENVDASADHVNSFTASDSKNTWVINAKNSGTLNSTDTNAGTKFTNFANLIGGNNDDSFAFVATGSLSGFIDGGNQVAQDIVDLSSLSGVNLLLGEDGVGYRHIELYKGNNVDSTITGSDANNTWTLGAGQNTGDINSTIFFTGFTTWVGGKGNDIFTVKQGALTGSINGGAGNDTLNITIAADSAEQIKFFGGADTNKIEVSGGSADYTAAHTATALAGGQLSYFQGNKTFSILYSDVAVVNDNLTAATLTVNNTFNPDVFTFTNNAYSLNSASTIHISNKANLVIAAAADDQVAINGVVDGLQSVTIQNATVSGTNDGLLKADSLNLLGTGTVGSAANRLHVNIANVSVSAINGDVYLQEKNALNIVSLSNNNRFDIVLDGDLTSSAALTSFGNVSIDATSGNIDLAKENALTGNISLASLNNINLRNVSVTNLNDVKAQRLTVNSTGAINGNGVVLVSDSANLVSGSNMTFMNAANNFNAVTIGSVDNASKGSVSIADSNVLSIAGINASGTVDTHSNGVNVTGAIDAASLTMDAGSAVAQIANTISTTKAITITANGITTSSNLTATDITLDGTTGTVTLNGKLDTSNKKTITVTGNSIIQNANISSGGDTSFYATSSLIQNANIDSAANIAVAADGDLTLNANATSKGIDIAYAAGGVMNLFGTLLASNSITLDGKKVINQSGKLASLGGDIAINAGQLLMIGEEGISTSKGAVLVTSTGDINTRNISAASDINLQAAGALQIDKTLTASAGTVALTAGNDIVLDADVVANSGIKIASTKGNVQQQAQLTTQQGDLVVGAGSDITMNSATVSTAVNGDIYYTGNNIAIASLNAANGMVKLRARSGAVTDNNSDIININAKRFEVDAATGIGAGDTLETRVSQLSVSNSQGDIAIENSGNVTVDRLRTDGSTRLKNLQGSVVLDNSKGNLFGLNPAESASETPDGATSSNYKTGGLFIQVDNGNLTASTSGFSAKNPDITATNASFLVPKGTVGTIARPLVVSVEDTLTLFASTSWAPVWGYGVAPATFENKSTIQGSLSDITSIGHAQLVQVESIEEVNPAVFTKVRNYVYDDVAILLPSDQDYSDSNE